MNKKQAIKVSLPFLMMVIILMSLTGCGGGGGGSKPTPTTMPITTPSPTVYRASGIGVILQSQSDEGEVGSLMKSALAVVANPSWKQLDLTIGGFRSQTFRATSATPAVTPGFLKDNVTYIFLTWEQVNGAGRYQIFYEGNKVWDSNDQHPDDPDDGPTIAYLDLDDELSENNLEEKCISEPGEYEFQVFALKSDTDETIIYQFSTVTVSLGMILGNYPTEINYTSDTPQLTWKGVEGADGYCVHIYDDSIYSSNKNKLFDSGTSLLTTTGFELTETELEAGSYYGVIVDAYAVDGSGRPLEITRGVDGFNI